MESRYDCSTSNAVHPIFIGQGNFTCCEDIMAESNFLNVTDDQIEMSKMLVVQKTMVLEERTLLSRKPIASQPIISQSSVISLQSEILTDDMEMCSQNSFMELCSQESTIKMDACSQESNVSNMDIASQESEPKIEDIYIESQIVNEAGSADCNARDEADCYARDEVDCNAHNEVDLKRKRVVNSANNSFCERDEETADLCESATGSKEAVKNFENRTLLNVGKNAKRLKK